MNCDYCGGEVQWLTTTKGEVGRSGKVHVQAWQAQSCPGPVDLSAAPNETAGAW